MTIFADVEVVSFVACYMSRHKDFPGYMAGDFLHNPSRHAMKKPPHGSKMRGRECNKNKARQRVALSEPNFLDMSCSAIFSVCTSASVNCAVLPFRLSPFSLWEIQLRVFPK